MRNFCLQCFRYSGDTLELWLQKYFVVEIEALQYMITVFDMYDSIQIFKVK